MKKQKVNRKRTENKVIKKFIEDTKLLNIAKNNIEKEGIILLELKMRVTKGDAHIYVFIHKMPTVSHKDCLMVTKLIKNAIEQEGFSGDDYSITVSSAGISRIFKSYEEHFIFVGSDIKIKFFTDDDDGKDEDSRKTSTLNAKLLEAHDGYILIELIENEKIKIYKKSIIKTKLNN